MPDDTLLREGGEGKLLLSLDAGWFESPSIFSQLHVIEEVLHVYEYDKDLPHDSVKAYELFDMIVGTGSGGLLAAMLGPLKMTIREALPALHNLHQSVFNPNKPSKPTPEKPKDRLRNAIKHLVEQRLGKEGLSLRMREVERLIPGCKFAITAMTSAHVASPTVFRGYRSRTTSPDCTLVDALRGTLANARLFPAVTFGEPIPQTYIGAEAGHPNPIETVLQEAETMFRNGSITTVLSIGCGRHEPIAVKGPTSFPAAMVQLVSSAQAASERASSRFSHHPEAYHRLDVDHLHTPTASSLTNVKANSLAYLAREEVRDQLNALILLMCSRPLTVKAEDVGRAKPGGLSRDVRRLPITTSTYDNMKTLSYAERASFNPDLVCLKDTRMHILRVIFEWMSEPGVKPPVMWLEGVVGSGKSSIAHSVAVEADRLGILGSSFFMTPGTSLRDVADQTSPTNEPPSLKNIVTSLIMDLGGQSDRFRWTIGEILGQKPRLATATPSVQLRDLLLPSLSSLSENHTYVWVIDGFDELMRFSDRSIADGFFGTLCSLLPSFPPHFIVFITSRPLPNHPLPQTHTVRRLPLDLLSPENDKDLDLISYAELQKLADYNRAFSIPPAGHRLAVAFRNKAGGHPLWLRVTREHLLTSLTPNEELEDILDLEGSKSLDYHQFMNATYAQVIAKSIDLTKSKNQKALKHVILVLLAVQRPLPLSTLLDILDGSTELPSTTFRSVTSHLRPLLLGFDSANPLEFIHLSLRDFFKSSTSFSDLIQDVSHSRDLSPGHFTLLLSAFRVMETHLRHEVSVDEEPPDHPALAYIAGAWPNHITYLNSTTHGPQLVRPLSDFLDRSFIAWLKYHPAIGLPFLFTQEFLSQAKHVVEHIWDEKVLSHRRTAETLDELRNQFEALRRYDDWRLTSNQAVELWRAQADSDAEDQQRLCIAIGNRARGLDKAGLKADALTDSEEAVAICRSLDQKDCGQLRSSGLSWLLDGFSNCLSAAGRHDEALAAIEEAVLLRRQLVHEQPKVFEADLAGSLNNFSIRLSDAGRHDEALAAVEEAVSLYRQLVQERPKVFEADLARSLTTFSNHLSNAGRHDEALAAVEEAVSLRRHLMQERPKVFEADLALSLTNFSIRLSDAVRHDEALAAVEEAVSLHRQLVQERPKVFEADLARSLTNFSNCLSDAGRHDDALAAVEEAV